MNKGRTVFAQLMAFMPDYEFNKCVDKYNGNYKIRTFSCRSHFYVMSFAQLTYRESLRDIEVCLKALSNKLYHSGISHSVSRSTLAEANETRDWRIYADFAQILIAEARKLYKKDNDFLLDIDKMAYALDSTTIDLCLNLFPWAKFRKNKAAVKAHTLLDLRGSIPTFIEITDGSVADINILDRITIEASAFYIMDRGYLDFERLYRLHQNRAYFIIRAKKNTANRRIYSRKVDKTTGLRCDQVIKLTGHYSKKNYPEQMRRIKFYDQETSNTYVFLTNNFELDALLICKLYKERWKVELFFKWIKQHLRIKSFYGTSYNAVCCQIWIAVCSYLLVAIVKKRLRLKHSLYTLLQIFSLTLFEKLPVNELFTKKEYKITIPHETKYLSLFDL
jgi:hypothetical protein